MNLKKLFAVLSMGTCVLVGSAVASDDVRITYSEPLTLIQDTQDAGVLQKLNDAPTLVFDAFGRRFDVALAPNTALLSAEMRGQLSQGVVAYRGSVKGAPGSWVRLVLSDGLPRGMLWDGSEMYAIDLVDNTAGGREAIMYKLTDMHVIPGEMSCGAETSVKTGADLLATMKREAGNNPPAEAPGASQQIDIGVVADFEFFERRGSDAEAALISRMNIVDGIFSEQLGVQLNVARLDIFDNASDPFTDENVAGDLLDEIQDYRRNNSVQAGFALTHLFTGRNLSGSTAGIAYLGVLCSRSFGVGLTEAVGSDTRDSLIAAHEFGHNFNAPHDGEGACESTPQDFLMAPRLNGVDQFSDCSIARMQAEVNQASCVSSLQSIDIAVAQAATPAAVLLGSAGEVQFAIDNVGTEEVAAVTVEVTIPNEVSLNSVSASSGSCTSGAGIASCDLGVLATATGGTVTLTATGTGVGSASFEARVTVATDQNFVNDQATSVLTVRPAVDVVAAATGGAVTVGQRGSVSASVRNNTSISATGIVADLLFSDGLRVEQASWSEGNCTVTSDTEVRCESDAIAAQAIGNITVEVTGLTEGGQSFSVAATSTETDTNTANNEATANISVNSVVTASGGDDGGGGAFGTIWLLLFGGVTFLVRVRRSAHR